MKNFKKYLMIGTFGWESRIITSPLLFYRLQNFNCPTTPEKVGFPQHKIRVKLINFIALLEQWVQTTVFACNEKAQCDVNILYEITAMLLQVPFNFSALTTLNIYCIYVYVSTDIEDICIRVRLWLTK